MISGTREHAEQMREHAAAVLAPMGLRLSAEKTKITHIDQGLDFLGVRHEAPSIRVEVKDRHRCAVAAA